jgi:hypothetical protein
MSSNQDQARLIAERVARRLSEQAAPPNDRVETNFVDAPPQQTARPRARVIDFVSSSPPPRTSSTINSSPAARESAAPQVEYKMATYTQSPWLAPFTRISSETGYPGNSQGANQNQQVSHPSQERFGVEEAAVSELVEFFENEKQCSVDPSGKPCDHCVMCSSRGF